MLNFCFCLLLFIVKIILRFKLGIFGFFRCKVREGLKMGLGIRLFLFFMGEKMGLLGIFLGLLLCLVNFLVCYFLYFF